MAVKTSSSVLFMFLLLVFTVDQGIGVSICSNPSAYRGRSLCDPWGTYCGECVSFVKVCTGDHRTTSRWRMGARVRGNSIPYGAAIATFPGGRYYGHAAIYIGQNSAGIQVWDQWRGQPVHSRTIRWGGSKLANDGNRYYVIQ